MSNKTRREAMSESVDRYPNKKTILIGGCF
jgi:hypothetical protein